jgi:hypothetical protein
MSLLIRGDELFGRGLTKKSKNPVLKLNTPDEK